MNKETLDKISVYMGIEIRERVHFDLAPCEPDKFLKRYLDLDPSFRTVLESEFGVEA